MHSDIEAILESTYDELNGKEDVEKVFVIGGKIRKIKAILGEQAHLDRDGVARVTLLTLQLFELYLKAMMYAEARIDDLETELKESRKNSSKEDARN
jgi:hypothetical protein